MADWEVVGEEKDDDWSVESEQPLVRRGGTRAEAKPFVGLTDAENARRTFAETDPRRVDRPMTVIDYAEQADALNIGRRQAAEREWQSLSPAGQEKARQASLADIAPPRPQVGPPSMAGRLAMDAQDVTKNPAARGAIAGFSNLAKVGTGAVRLASDLLGADGVADFAKRSEGLAGATESGAMQGLSGNDKLVADIFASITNSAPSLAMGVVGGPAMSTLFAQSTLQEYGAGRDAGFGADESLMRAGIMGTAEVLGERFGFPEQVKLLKGIAKGMPTNEVAKLFGSLLAKEIPGEQLTTAMQFMADKIGPAALSPNATVEDYLKAAGHTLQVTVGQTLLMGGGPAAISTVRDQYRQADAGAERGAMSLAERAAADNGFGSFQQFLTPKSDKPLKPLKPSEARTASIDRFGEMAAAFGLPEKALTKAREAAANMPAADVPGFLARLTEVYSRNGLFAKPPDPESLTALQAAVDGTPEEQPAAEAGEEVPATVVDNIEATLRRAGALPDEAIDGTGLADDSSADALRPGAPNVQPGPQVGQANAAALQGGEDGAALGAKLLRDSVATEAFREQGLGGLDVPTRRAVLAHVVNALENLQVRDRVVELVPIDVVHILAGQKGPAKVLLHDESVLKNLLSLADSQAIPGGRHMADAVDALVSGVAQATAERSATGPLLALSSSEAGAATGADKIDGRQVVTPTSDDELGPLLSANSDGPPTVSNNSRGRNAGAQPELPSPAADVPGDGPAGPGAPAGSAGGVGSVPGDAERPSGPAAEPAGAGGRDAVQREPAGDPDAALNAAAPVSTQAPAKAGATEAAAPAKRVIGSYGRTPKSATPIELRANDDGTLTPFDGKYPMLDYETGDPISLRADTTDAQAADAIRKAKAITAKDKWFGVKDESNAAPASSGAMGAPDGGSTDTQGAATNEARSADLRQRADALKKLIACLQS